MWSETAVIAKNTQALNDLWATARNISTTYGIYLGITYSQYLDEQTGTNKNMFTLFDPRGQIAFEYQKAHPVIMVETDTIPGPNHLPVADTEYGRMGAAICFDMDFQNFIAQAGDQKVDILLQPSWTWGKVSWPSCLD
jgi:predicted amidohydrolase